MKLSEAIRIGAAKRPQAIGDYVQYNGGYCTCALGAAYEAITGNLPPNLYDAHGEVDNVIMRATQVGIQTQQAVVDRNDAGQTREEIAAWLEEQGL